MSRQEICDEILTELSEMAVFLEDNARESLGGSYSVNLNFRREGDRLYTSMQCYGLHHIGQSREFSIGGIRASKRIQRIAVMVALAGIGVLAVAAGRMI